MRKDLRDMLDEEKLWVFEPDTKKKPKKAIRPSKWAAHDLEKKHDELQTRRNPRSSHGD